MRWILGLLPLLCLCHGQKAPDFPDFHKMFMGGYQFKSELVTKDNKVVYVDEYFDTSEDVGRLDITINNAKESVFYDAEFSVCTRVKYADNLCFEETLVEFSVLNFDNFVIPAFAYDKDKYVLGPSAVFHMARDKKKEYGGTEIVRGIDTDVFTFTYGTNDQATVYIYFTRDTWTDAFTGKKGSFPVRIKLDGPIKLESGNELHVFQTFDITFLVPYVKDFTLFQIPAGIGCSFKKEDIKTPELPNSFSFVAERYDVTKGETTKESTIDIYKIWYDEDLRVCRLETFTKDFFGNYQVVDFNKGILYNFDQHGVCRILSSYETVFTEHSGKVTPRLKTPKELLQQNIGKPYYVGKARVRGIMCDAWETVATDYNLNEEIIPKYVHTFYYSAENWVDNMPGSTKERIPIRQMTSIYDYKDKDKASYKLRSRVDGNNFAFKEDLSEDRDKFNVANCYPAAIERAFVEIIFRPDLTSEFLVELNNFQATQEILLAFMMSFNITSLRLPFISIDYEPNLMKARILLLEASNIFDSFYCLSDAVGFLVGPDKNAKQLDGTYPIPTDCARECLVKKSCSQFYYCEEKQLCFLTDSNEISAEGGGEDAACKWYTKADSEVTGPEPNLKELVSRLKSTVKSGAFKITLIVDGKEIELTATDANIIDVNSKIDQDLHKFRVVLPSVSLNPKKDTVLSSISANTQFDCYRKCEDASEIACVSFAFCPSTNECFLTSTYVAESDEVEKKDILVKNTKCSVYSKTYINLFDKYEGTVTISAKSTITNVNDAEDCAQHCKNSENKESCRGFEFCSKDNTCFLHSTHFLDIKDDDKGPVREGCIHYSLKFSLDYYATGKHLITHENDEQKTEISVEECSKYCSEDKGASCKSFNYCPGGGESEKGSCIVHEVTISDGKDDKSTNCELYTKKSVSDAILNPKKPVEGGVTPGGMVGVIFLTLFIGIILGAALFMGYSYYKSKKLNDDGMTVRFVKTEE